MRDAFLQIIRETRSSKPSSITGLLHPVIGKLLITVKKQSFKHPASKLPQFVSVLLQLRFEIPGTETLLEFGRHGIEDLVEGEFLTTVKGVENVRTSLSSSTVISRAKLSPYSSTAPSTRDSDSAAMKNICLRLVNNALHVGGCSILP